jgi:hypothetical protein
VKNAMSVRVSSEGRRRPRELARREKLDIPLSEAIDLLAELGVRSRVEYDDYLKGLSTAMAFVKTSRRRALRPLGTFSCEGRESLANEDSEINW